MKQSQKVSRSKRGAPLFSYFQLCLQNILLNVLTYSMVLGTGNNREIRKYSNYTSAVFFKFYLQDTAFLLDRKDLK